MTKQNAEIVDVSNIAGNASGDIKRTLANYRLYRGLSQTEDPDIDSIFGRSIQKSLRFVEISIKNHVEESQRLEGRVVLELDVSKGMLNEVGILHGGCSAYLVDITSAYALSALHLHLTGRMLHSVSQMLAILYHSPALKGEKLRLVNQTLFLDGTAISARTEIWNVTKHCLVASGVHSKMVPSSVKAML
ncbi:hypothetical protein CPB83DRAFT_814464 [Crepidotus variabilis]|uniref:Thioesterase domain-containing protein n=1 Tax=Crepidotus variabilis TaxID=179855 RepID=A0A9P6JPA5_9AGAR|nr:hypothetical protein CPB83DRAFT_814464 [Crepidotus variabilis]